MGNLRRRRSSVRSNGCKGRKFPCKWLPSSDGDHGFIVYERGGDGGSNRRGGG
ncbi:hypothetical protein AALP_AA5G196100 [Arabis alpina]|uniref:Uncharacterized protein n=1 Tax=Arabis alpina TaxID=50452 RepID=A0A087GY57_ARAAL|nr:hypothetical protein AALP_AA5G196100 [Arabis alpina]